MESTAFIIQYQNRIGSFESYFEACKTGGAVEDVHQLRVSIKRLRTILSLMEFAGQDSFRKKKHFRLLSNLFSVAGQLREIHVNQQLIQSYDPDITASYMSALLQIEEDAQLELHDKMHQFKQHKFIKQNQKLEHNYPDLPIEESIASTMQFIEIKVAQIDGLSIDCDDKKLHKIRFHLKGVVEMYKLINSIRPTDQSMAAELTLKELEQIIGNWHDRMVLIASLEQYIDSVANTDKTASLAQLLHTIVIENEESKSGILKLLDEVLRGI